MDGGPSGLIKAIRVSSTLNNDVKQFGKKYLMDGKDDTCWNSDEVSNILFAFEIYLG